MKLPDYPVSGEYLRESWGRSIIDYLRAITFRSSSQMLITQTANGTTGVPMIKPSRAASEFKVLTYPDPNESQPPCFIVPYKRCFMAVTLREYGTDGVILDIGDETYPLAEGHTLKPTWDWIRAVDVPANE